MRRKVSIDWLTVSLFLVLAIMGWFSIYSTSIKDNNSVFDFSTYHGRQMAFMGISFLICAVILMLDTKFVEFLSYILYGSTLFLMILAAIFARSRI